MVIKSKKRHAKNIVKSNFNNFVTLKSGTLNFRERNSNKNESKKAGLKLKTRQNIKLSSFLMNVIYSL